MYLSIKDDIECVKWVNDNLIDEMSWQDLPELQHDEVNLGAELDLFYEGWHQDISLTNYASIPQIEKEVLEGMQKYDEA